MKKIRVIVSSTENGNEEQVVFTEEFDKEVDYFIPPGSTVDIDTIIEDNLPSGFPKEYTLKRE